MKLLKRVLISMIIFSLIFQSMAFAVSTTPQKSFLEDYLTYEIKTNPYLDIEKIYLEAGNYSVEYKDLSIIKKVAVIDDKNDVKFYLRPSILPQRDIFSLKTFNNEIVVNKDGCYTIITYLTKKVDVVPGMNKYTKRTSALKKEDLHSWSASYTDDTYNEVTNNGATYVNMAKYAPEIISFSQVSTKLNRTFTVLDSEDIVIQRKDFADILIKVNEELMKSGYRLLIYDGYRTKASTGKLLQYTLDDIKKPSSEREYPEINNNTWGQYVVIPNGKNDKHGKGTASDVSLVDMKTGEIINMPTPVNTMNHLANVGYTKSVSKAYTILWEAMNKYGIKPFKGEWYHFSYVAKSEFGFPTDDLRKNFYPNKIANGTPSNWAIDEIEWMKSKKILPLSLLKDYKRAITKEEFTVLTINLLEKHFKETIEVPEVGFLDTNMVNLNKAKQIGIATGSYGKFGPPQSLTREQSATIASKLHRYLYVVEVLAESETLVPTDSLVPLEPLAPVEPLVPAESLVPTEPLIINESPLEKEPSKIILSETVSEWARDDIAYVLDNNLMSLSSDEKFKPKDFVSVEEAIALLYKIANIQMLGVKNN